MRTGAHGSPRGPLGREQQVLLPRAPERRPVRVRGAEVRVPRVEVGVEVHERDRPVPSVHRAEQRRRDRVVAPDRAGASIRQDVVRGGLDLRDRLADVEQVAADVAGVRDLLGRERVDVQARMVGAEEAGGAADRLRSEARRAVGHAAVERDAEDGDVADVDVLAAREAGERRGSGEPGHDERIGGPDRRRRLAPEAA